MNEIFTPFLAVSLFLFVAWCCRFLPRERWQILAVRPAAKLDPIRWQGVNYTFYGLGWIDSRHMVGPVGREEEIRVLCGRRCLRLHPVGSSHPMGDALLVGGRILPSRPHHSSLGRSRSSSRVWRRDRSHGVCQLWLLLWETAQGGRPTAATSLPQTPLQVPGQDPKDQLFGFSRWRRIRRPIWRRAGCFSGGPRHSIS